MVTYVPSSSSRGTSRNRPPPSSATALQRIGYDRTPHSSSNTPSRSTSFRSVIPYEESSDRQLAIVPSYDSTSNSHSRAPSVSSRTSDSTARQSHRHHRHSYSRGENHQRRSVDLQNTFPWFSQTGDTEIIIRDPAGKKREKHYLLHSLILAQNSDFFASDFAIDNHNPRDGPPDATDGDRGRELLRLTYNSDTSRSSSKLSSHSTQVASERPRYRYELDWDDQVVQDVTCR